MTVKHEHINYASKTSLKLYMSIVLAVVAGLSGMVLFSFQKSDAAVEQTYELEIDVAAHKAEYEFVKQDLIEIKEDIKSQHSKLDTLAKDSVRQESKLDEISRKLDDCIPPKPDVVGIR